jgi:magnesium transporter
MKFLATITIVMSIPTMVASFYGMNVNPAGVPFADSPYGFWIVLGLTLILTLSVAWIFSKKDLF